MSSGGQTTTSSMQPPQWYSDAARGYLGQAQGVANLPFEQYQGQRVAGISPMTRYGQEGIYGMAGGTPYTDAAGGMLTETLNGGGMNPYQSGVVDRVTRDATNAYYGAANNIMDQFNTAGNWGGSAQMQALDRTNEAFARGLGDAIAPIYQSGYENERGRQMQAAGLASGLYDTNLRGNQAAISAGDLDRQYNQSLLDSQYGDWTRWLNYPQQQLDTFGNALSRTAGGAGSTQTQTGPGPDRLQQGVGTMMLGSMLGKNK